MRIPRLLLLFGLVFSCADLNAANIIVTPTAPHNGAGSLASPMSLWRAIGMVDASGSLLLQNPASIVAPGDHIKLRAGTYKYTLPFEPLNGNTILGLWGVYTQGTADKPIWIEPYGDGPVILDGSLSGNPYVSSMHRNFTVWAFEPGSQYTYLFNVRVTNSDPSNRILSTSASNCPPWSTDESNRCDARGGGYNDGGIGNRAIHVNVDNTGQGFFLSNSSSGMEWCIARLNGWDALDRTHGHGAYIQSDNSQGQKTVTDTIIFGNLDNELNARGSSTAAVNNILFLRDAFYSGRVLVGDPADVNITFTSFYGFQQRDQNYVLSIGESETGNTGNTVQDSYFYSRNGGGNSNHDGLQFNFADDAVAERNTILADSNIALVTSASNPPLSNFKFNNNNYNEGDSNSLQMASYNNSAMTLSQWQAIGAGFDPGSVFNSPSKFSTTVLGNASPWIAGYSMVVIYNPSGADSITLSASFLKSLGYSAGNSLTLTNVQDYDNDVIQINNWNGQDYALDMRSSVRTQAMPLGMTPATMNNPADYDDYANSFPYFATFVIQRTSIAQGSIQSFNISNLAAAVLTTNGGANSTGYAVIQPSAPSNILAPISTTPAGMAIYDYRQNGILISETAVPASPLVTSGRTFVELAGSSIDTGIAIANPNVTPAAITFYFTDSTGRNFGQNSFTVAAHQQIAGFIDQPPFAADGPFAGTLTFLSSSPVAVIALRGLTNELGEFLLSTQKISPVSESQNGANLFAHFADGGGWTTQIVLVNQSDETVQGTLQFFSQGSQTGPGAPLSTSTYSIAPRSYFRLGTAGTAAGTVVGSVRLTPAMNNLAPFGFATFSLTNDGATLTQTAISAEPAGSAFRLYFETSGSSGALSPVMTALAIANSADTNASVNFELLNLAGVSTGLNANATIPASGQLSIFVDDLFPSVTAPFQGLVRISSSTPVALTGLRTRYNEEGDFLITATPVSNEATPPSGSMLVFPQIADGNGYTTQFILYSGAPGQVSTGTIQFFNPSGAALPLTFE